MVSRAVPVALRYTAVLSNDGFVLYRRSGSWGTSRFPRLEDVRHKLAPGNTVIAGTGKTANIGSRALANGKLRNCIEPSLWERFLGVLWKRKERREAAIS